MIRILLVESHPIARNGIKTILERENDFEVVGEVSDGTEVLSFIEKNQDVDILLTDIQMPKVSGLDLLALLRKTAPSVKIVLLTLLDHFDYIVTAFQAGAWGYILKNVSIDELLFGIRHVHLRNVRYLCSELSNRLLDKTVLEFASNSRLSSIDLTKREIEILSLIAEGYTNHEIAEKLFTSKRTVEGHRQNLLLKTGARNSTSLIRLAILNGLIN